jgi:hypothetical protein
MADESHWIERAQSAEAKLKTLQDSMEPLKAKVRGIKDALCARERTDGSFDIDFDRLAERLGVAACLELRGIIDARYSISGAPGRKPRVRVKAAPADPATAASDDHLPEASGDHL